jgi:aminoglycoside phosphotransferase (APT) family kinase protein
MRSEGRAMSEQFVGTMPVLEHFHFDVGAPQDCMRAHVEGFRGELTVEQFKGGQSNPTFALTGLSVAERGAIYDDMNRVLATLHGVDVAAVSLTDFGCSGKYVTRQINRWSKQYLASQTTPIDAMDRLIAWTRAEALTALRHISTKGFPHGIRSLPQGDGAPEQAQRLHGSAHLP